MKRTSNEQGLVFFGLIALTVGLRLFFQYLPNFAPVAAVALFSGYYFRSRRVALLVPLSVMLISDAFIGGYQPILMLTVYGLLAIPVMMRTWLRSSFDLSGESRSASRAVAGLLGCSLTASILFFVVTNIATWWVTPWYPRTAVGLVECVTAAIPFFRYTVTGDLIFGSVLFGAYAFAASRGRVAATRPSSLSV